MSKTPDCPICRKADAVKRLANAEEDWVCEGDHTAVGWGDYHFFGDELPYPSDSFARGFLHRRKDAEGDGAIAAFREIERAQKAAREPVLSDDSTVPVPPTTPEEEIEDARIIAASRAEVAAGSGTIPFEAVENYELEYFADTLGKKLLAGLSGRKDSKAAREEASAAREDAGTAPRGAGFIATSSPRPDKSEEPTDEEEREDARIIAASRAEGGQRIPWEQFKRESGLRDTSGSPTEKGWSGEDETEKTSRVRRVLWALFVSGATGAVWASIKWGWLLWGLA